MANWTNNEYVNALLVGAKHASNFLTYRVDNSGENWSVHEIAALENALSSWSDVADLTFIRTTSSNADLSESLYTSAQQGDLGVHSLIIDYQSTVVSQHNANLSGSYNTNGFGWDDNATGGLSVGGFGYATLVHEIGHALGLDHTHSDDASDPHVFPGVTSSLDIGTNDLNQDVYSVMSYVSGEISRTLYAGEIYNYGFVAGPMAFDIAAIQYLYGANTSKNAGDNVYYLPTSNARGTFFEAVWDTGGNDTIAYEGALSSTIDLRSATLGNEAGGGGFLSSADGIYGGFTIAGDFTDALANVSGETGVIIENARGGSGNDDLIGNKVDNELRGNAGDDQLDGGAGIDTAVFNGDFDDYELVVGASGESVLITDGTGTDGTDTLVNIERLEFSDQNANLILASNAVNNVTGSINSDVVFGLNGNDRINASLGIDRVYGGAGNDLLIGGDGADLVDGGSNDAGGDTASWSNSNAGVQVNLETGSATGGHATGDTLVNIENLFGSTHADNLVGDANSNTINGFTGDDILSGGMGGANSVIGGSGNDTFVGGAGIDFMNGGSGFADQIDYSNSSVGVIAHLGGDYVFDLGDATGDSFSGIENIIGSSEADSLVGTQRKNIFTGGDGDDFINTAGGNDQLYGGAGDDTLIGGLGADIIDGGANSSEGDTARYVNSNVKVIVSLTDGTGYSGHSAQDTLIGIENLFGSVHNDRLTGDLGANKLSGHTGDDRLDGRTGDDTLIGGAGSDEFRFSDVNFGNDTITDWEDGSDMLDLRPLGLNYSDFTKANIGGNTVLTYDLDPNQTITLLGVDTASIDNGDFL